MATPLPLPAGDLRLLLIMGATITVAAALITLGPRYLPAAEVNLLALIEMMLGPLWVWWALGEVPTVQALISALVITPTLVAHSVLGLRAARTAATREPAVEYPHPGRM
jgi:drug/metabolite transporter (DMT)-like permease